MNNFNPFAQIDYSKFFGDLSLPKFDLEALTDSHRRNIEALTNANRVVTEGFQTLIKKQTDIARDTISKSYQAYEEALSQESYEKKAAKQTDAIKGSYKEAVKNIEELAGIIQKANAQTVDIINKRAEEILEEVKETIQKPKAPSKKS